MLPRVTCYLGFKAHAEHAVDLIQHQHLHSHQLNVCPVVLQDVVQSCRCADQQLGVELGGWEWSWGLGVELGDWGCIPLPLTAICEAD